MSSSDDAGDGDDGNGVYHHVDYKSKADMRRRELEELRKRSIANSQAAKLADAEAPTTDMMLQFQERQKQLFEEQRRNQAAAMEYLHQYRADDQRILKEQRRRVSTESQHATAITPDAKAATFVYDEMLTDLPFAETPSTLDNPPPNATPPPPPNTALTEQFATRHETLEMASPMSHEKSVQHSDSHETEANLICEGCSGDEGNHVLDSTTTTTTTSRIPFESFLKLGESQIMGATTMQEQKSNDFVMLASSSDKEEDLHESTTILQGSHDNNNNFAESDGDDSIIPMESFMALGASMLADAIGGSKSDDEQKPHNDNNNNTDDDVTASLTEAEQSSHMDDSSSLVASVCQQSQTTGTTTTIVAAPPSSTSPIHEAETEVEHQASFHEMETPVQSGATLSADHITEMKKNGENVTILPNLTCVEQADNTSEDEHTDNHTEASCKDPSLVGNVLSDEVEITGSKDFQTNASCAEASSTPEDVKSASPTDNTLTSINPDQPIPKEASAVSESSSHSDSACEPAASIDGSRQPEDDTKDDNEYEHDAGTEDTEESSTVDTPVESSSIPETSNHVQQESNDESASEEPIAASDPEITETPASRDDDSESKTNYAEAGEEHGVIAEEVGPLATPTPDRETQPRRRRLKKKQGYYPTSSHFVARHYFSR